jgi:acyl-coenzyme A thioesterase 13
MDQRFRVLSASNGRVDFELDLHRDHTVSQPSPHLNVCNLTSSLQNRLQSLHGGTLASLVDLGGSLAVASTGRFATGVSTDLNGMYLGSG